MGCSVNFSKKWTPIKVVLLDPIIASLRKSGYYFSKLMDPSPYVIVTVNFLMDPVIT